MAGTHAISMNEQIQKYADEYLIENEKASASAREIAAWLIKTGKWEAPADVLIQFCKNVVSRALREQYTTNEQGQAVRVKHAIRHVSGGQQTYLWVDIRTAEPEDMQSAFFLRREQIVGDCKQLKRDIDYYNGHNEHGAEIQTIFDFRDDLEEGSQDLPKKPR